jgi:acetolactate synthase regulatory subunit
MATVTMNGVDAAVGLIVGSAEAVVRLEQFVEHVVDVRAARFASCTAHASLKAS